jgi:putative transcriptional regulator
MTKLEIAKLRKDLGLSQVQFGQLLDVHFMTVSKWERGDATPSAYQIAFMEHFRKTADTEKARAQEQLQKLLVGAGVMAALLFLLSRG